jgi:cysteine desulfurase
MTRVRDLRDRLERGLLQRITGAIVLGGDNRVPNTLNIAFEHLESDAILLLLNQQGIAASPGSACASGSMDPSHVLRAMKVPYSFIHGAVRFSLSRETTATDVDRVVEAMPAIVDKLRGPSLAVGATVDMSALQGSYI